MQPPQEHHCCEVLSNEVEAGKIWSLALPCPAGCYLITMLLLLMFKRIKIQLVFRPDSLEDFAGAVATQSPSYPSLTINLDREELARIS